MRAPALLVFGCLLALGGCRSAQSGAPADAGPRPPEPSREWLSGTLPAPQPGERPRRGGTLTVRLPVEPTGLTRLHDAMAEGTQVRITVGPLYETLATVDPANPSGPLKPLLARAWEESDDRRTLTVHLREGVRFHDGTPLRARDFAAVVAAIRQPSAATAGMRAHLEGLESAVASDESTLVVRWRRPYFLATRTFLGAVPAMPAKALEGDFDTLAIHRAPVGTGPFRFERWVPGESLSYVRNDDYWGRPAWVDRLVFRFVKDDAVAVQAWRRGDFDVMTRVPPAAWRGVEAPSEANRWAIEGYRRVLLPENTYSWIGWNEARPFFADARVRRALAMLYPRDAVSRLVDLGLETPTTCPYFEASPSCDPTVHLITLDEAGAGRLLDEAGWARGDDGLRRREGTPLRFTFLGNAFSPRARRLLPLYQEALRRAGIDTDIEAIDPGAFGQRLRSRDFDAVLMAWSSNDAVIDAYPVFHSSQVEAGSNWVGYADADIDALLSDIRAEFDPLARQALERRVHRALYEAQVYLFLSRRPQLDALKQRVHGLSPGIGWYRLQDAWLAE